METTDSKASDADAPAGRILRRGLTLIGSYIKVHPLPFSLAVSCAALYAAMTVGTSVVLGRVTDRVITPAFEAGNSVDGSTVVVAMVVVLAVAVLRGIGIVGRRFFAGMFVARTQATLRTG